MLGDLIENSREISMTDISLDAMKSFLAYLYSDTLTALNPKVEAELLNLAIKYKVSRLQAVLEGSNENS